LLFVIGSAYSLYTVVKDTSWENGVVSFSITFLVMIFVASFSLKDANSLIGYKDLCDDIQSVQKETNAESVNTIYVHRAENMGLYLNDDINDYAKDADRLLEEKPEGLLVIKTDHIDRSKDLETFLEGKPYSRSGLYRIYQLD